MAKGDSEAQARILIDKALEASGWNLLDPKSVRLEVSGDGRRSDYVLSGLRSPLCVLEAKRDGLDPYDAKEQARGCAENLNAPFVILSNGREHWFWNYRRHDQDAYRIERLPSPTDLERLRLKNLQPPRPLLSEVISPDWLRAFRPDLKLRRYQLLAIAIVSRLFDERQLRKFLLEMATGTGKTLLCAALIRCFLLTRNAERVLFIVDRIELARQTLEDFAVILADFKPVLFKTARRRPGELLGSSVVVATLQSLMVDRRYRTEFTPFHFDLVINDEAHRSIYGDSREVVQFFQATRIGLTATPKAYLKNINLERLEAEEPKALEARQLRDTYHYFGCEPGQPTFRYDLVEAVQDPEGPFLCLPKIFDLRSDITTQALADSGWAVVVNEQEENFKIQDLERKVFTPARNRVMCEAFLQEAQRDPAGLLGKSIIFAVNQAHATALTKIFNELQPGIAVTITSRIEDAASIAKEFRDGKRSERIAVSVDMLSTGYNCRDLKFQEAIEAEDDDAVETMMNERFYHRPEMFYSPDKLIVSYGVPAPTPAFVYNAVGRKPLPTREAIVADTVDSIAARFNLRYSEQKWVDATAQLLAEDSRSLERFMKGDMTLFTASQFNQLGGVTELARFDDRDQVFEALRQSTLIRQSLLAQATVNL